MPSMGTMPPSERALANREKTWVALTSLAAAVLLTLAKLGIGLWTHSLGILAEAAHSGLDLVAAVVTLWAVRKSGEPPDQKHTYGHGKYENLSALFQTGLLLITCLWIMYEAGARLLNKSAPPVDANVWAFGVVIMSIVVDFSRSRALKKAAIKHKSQALEADALHFSTDIWSSFVVLGGLGCVFMSGRFGLPWLANADSVAALGVAVIVLWVTYNLAVRSTEDLLDVAPESLRSQVESAALVEGAREVKQVRVRRAGAEVFADVVLGVDQAAAFEHAHEVADRAEEAIRAIAPNADVVVHVEPVEPPAEEVSTRVRMIAARHGLGAHSIRVYDDADARSLDLHLEVSDSLSLGEAHQRATDFEKSVKEVMPDLTSVVTHIEPTGDTVSRRLSQPGRAALIQAALNQIMCKEHPGVTASEVRVRTVGEDEVVSFRCALDASIGIRDAHEITERVEKRLRERIPKLARVVIHVAPKDDDT